MYALPGYRMLFAPLIIRVTDALPKVAGILADSPVTVRRYYAK